MSVNITLNENDDLSCCTFDTKIALQPQNVIQLYYFNGLSMSKIFILKEKLENNILHNYFKRNIFIEALTDFSTIHSENFKTLQNEFLTQEEVKESEFLNTNKIKLQLRTRTDEFNLHIIREETGKLKNEEV
jgi:hypothetical protein